jgi:glycosyltransferase involved in cell wall biosynthesis
MDHSAAGAERILPRKLAGATVLQLVPSLADDAQGRTALNVAQALLRAGARAIVAGDGGPLVEELETAGGQWVELADARLNPLQLKRNAQELERIVATERVDIVHAQSPSAAWSARAARARLGAWLVTSFPEAPWAHAWYSAALAGALRRGDHIIANSAYTASRIGARYQIPPTRISVIPRSIDTTRFDPAAIRPETIGALRRAWGIPSGIRVIVVPGRVAHGNGQHVLVDAARLLAIKGLRGITFVLVGDARRHARYARSLLKRAQEQNVHHLFRMIGHFPDIPAALATAELIVVPAIEPPLFGRVVAEAQAMARPVVSSEIGAFPENLVAPPRVSDALRTGWLVPPNEPLTLAEAIETALSLDDISYSALGARAREFITFAFSPPRVAAATLAVYTSVLEGDGQPDSAKPFELPG